MTHRPARTALSVFVSLIVLSVTAFPVAAQTAPPAGGPQADVASYQIAVTLDPETKQLRGSERITYRNPSGDTLSELWLRLYLNAFRADDTLWMREAGGGHRGYSADMPGWIRLEELALAATGAALPLPEGHDTETIVRVPLPQPLAPGETAALDLRWTAQLLRVFARTGFAGDFVMAGQWYPKLAVYDRGRWDTEPWHANAEFFADFGNYDLALTVPAEYVTGASGLRLGEDENGDGSKTVRYRAERVTDVAWTAWPGFAVFEREVQAAGTATRLELLLPPAEADNADRHFSAAQAALDAFGSWYGVYPWPKLTVVVPPDAAGGAGGMEYPTLVTTGTNGPAPLDLPMLDDNIRALEIVTIHEIAHEWFPMQVQSNEAREAWLDEGFADYMTTRLLARLYGPDRSMTDLPLVRIGYGHSMRGQVGAFGTAREPLAQPSWEFDSMADYAATVYAKGTLALGSLEGLLGDERFTAALRHYADEWRWRHPTSADLRASLEESTGEDLAWFFDSFVHGTDVVDYAVANIDGERAVVERQGEVAFPVDVRLTLADGSSRVERWQGGDETLVLEGGGQAIAAVAVDPNKRIALELERIDNTRVVSPDPAGSLGLVGRWLAFAQTLLQMLGQVG